eukprot:6414125-Amphidinium_carterae.1
MDTFGGVMHVRLHVSLCLIRNKLRLSINLMGPPVLTYEVVAHYRRGSPRLVLSRLHSLVRAIVAGHSSVIKVELDGDIRRLRNWPGDNTKPSLAGLSCFNQPRIDSAKT